MQTFFSLLLRNNETICVVWEKDDEPAGEIQKKKSDRDRVTESTSYGILDELP